MDKEGFVQKLKDSIILWVVGQMFHTRLSDAVLEDLSALGIESLDRELTTRKECNTGDHCGLAAACGSPI